LESVPVVLVVEDEEPLQEIVHDALKEGGFDLTTVASGREAVAMIESGVVKYSALVTDVNLKGSMKGWEIARLVIREGFETRGNSNASNGSRASLFSTVLK
jgi:CheY-like chemotaxis protein